MQKWVNVWVGERFRRKKFNLMFFPFRVRVSDVEMVEGYKLEVGNKLLLKNNDEEV